VETAFDEAEPFGIRGPGCNFTSSSVDKDSIPKKVTSQFLPSLRTYRNGSSTNGIVVAVAEPIPYKRQRLGEKYIWGKTGPSEGQSFEDWKEFLKWEEERRVKAARGEHVPEGVDGVLICVLDEMHKDAIVGLAPLGLHIMCEKPLATNLADCVSIYKAMLPNLPNTTPSKIFSIGHVLRYSPHNMLLRKLLVEDKAIGEVMSINHTEPVGWWHFTHSYVRYAIENTSNAAKD
jgi:predicted dehydrogenase